MSSISHHNIAGSLQINNIFNLPYWFPLLLCPDPAPVLWPIPLNYQSLAALYSTGHRIFPSPLGKRMVSSCIPCGQWVASWAVLRYVGPQVWIKLLRLWDSSVNRVRPGKQDQKCVKRWVKGKKEWYQRDLISWRNQGNT